MAHTIRTPERLTYLHYAVQQGDLGLVRLFLEYGTPIEGRPNSRIGRTALHEAAQKGSVAVIELLLEHKAQVNSVTWKQSCTMPRNLGWSALHFAQANEKAAKLLLERGADHNLRDACGLTPLHCACMINFAVFKADTTNVIELLLDSGANPFLRTTSGKRPLKLYFHDARGYYRYIEAQDRGKCLLRKAMDRMREEARNRCILLEDAPVRDEEYVENVRHARKQKMSAMKPAVSREPIAIGASSEVNDGRS